jgi:hypothetical protein
MLKSLLRLLERRKRLAAAVGRTITDGHEMSCPYIRQRRDGEMNSPLQKAGARYIAPLQTRRAGDVANPLLLRVWPGSFSGRLGRLLETFVAVQLELGLDLDSRPGFRH